MFQREFAGKVASFLRKEGVRKSVFTPKHTFHISDDEGNQKDFSVKGRERIIPYTADDVTKVIEACIEVAKEALKRGDDIAIKNFGSLGIHYRKARHVKSFDGVVRIAEGRYCPKFNPGKDLKACAMAYQASLEDIGEPQPLYEEGEFDEFDDIDDGVFEMDEISEEDDNGYGFTVEEGGDD